jgi:hypothetical protein
MGVHCERLATAKAHRRFVGGTKAALQKWALEKLHPEIPSAVISARAIEGAHLLFIPVPPMLEKAMGYRWALHFVEFGYSRAMVGQPPSDEDLWIRRLRHPLVAPRLPESQYPTGAGKGALEASQ